MTKDSCCHLTGLMVNCRFDATLCIFLHCAFCEGEETEILA